ncbi:hypothetical protein [Spirosoma fluminis]
MKEWFILDRSDWLLLGQYPIIPFVNYFILGEPYLADATLFLSHWRKPCPSGASGPTTCWV